MVAEYLYVGDKSSITIKNVHISEILFPALVVLGDAKLIFELESTTHLRVRYRDTFVVSTSSLIDLTSVKTKT